MNGTRAGEPPPSLVDRVARAALVVLALVLPFEASLGHVGPLQVTTVELALYAALAAWGLTVASDVLSRPASLREAATQLRHEPLVLATMAWTAVLFVAAAATGSYRTACLKFALRSLSGVLVFFAARSLVRSLVARRWMVLALIIGALLSAATALVESVAPSTDVVWSVFREGSFGAYNLPRASGVFGYPTVGAMYWEAVIPLLVVVPFLGAAPVKGSRAPFFAVCGAAVLFGGILASATRSALAGAALTTGALVVLTRRWDSLLARTGAGVLGALVVTMTIAVAAPGAGSLLGQRLRFWRDDTWFRVEYGVSKASDRVEAGELFATAITLRNTGTLTWRHADVQPTLLANHWYFADDAGGKSALLAYDGVRTDLPEDVPPGGIVRVLGVAEAPALAGTYRLVWDLVQEDVTWFGEHGNELPEEEVVVVPATDKPAGKLALHAHHGPRPKVGRPLLWRAAVTLWLDHPLVGVGPDNFRRLYEGVLPPPPTGEPYTDTRIHANSLYFETLADLGLLGVLALGALGAALVLALRRCWEARDVAGLGFGLAAATFFVHGVSDYFLEFTPTFGLHWMLLGLLAAPRAGLTPPATRTDSPA